MGPRSFDRGKPFELTEEADRFGVSMGPRSFDRGKGFMQSTLAAVGMLLQWGRDRLTAESRLSRSRLPATSWSFNGAAIV